ncbi:hypothetical protein DFR52_101906 [Hoeflea marina]|uniref:Cell pole-organizing protein PopZ n=1 Tax=Hoeflea marina TaxID=274592 RepID=A0A317PU66_9HYPH|nr:PopZ family protein [Hoeflea marina]PWW04214.1 hypothetical protein DFR52_101906 [Hoeflea marina]
MAQAGAQREPSMEEILASIRRIIESNEPAEQPLADDHGDEDLDAAADADVGHLSHASLADVAARVRAEGAGNGNADAQQDVAELMRLALVADDVDSPQPRPEAAGPAPEQAAPSADDRHSRVVNTQGSSPFAPRQAYPAEPDPVATRAEPAASRPEPAMPVETGQAVPHAGGQLISMDAGAKVAASFDHLSATLAASSTRSFDEIAEELLKPMLQNWLDDNLPTLVERLVREEIERVSRGTRR